MSQLRRSRPKQGFTLVELMVVVAVIGILSGIAIFFSGNEWRRERVNTVAVELAGWLEEVRNGSLRETSSNPNAGGCIVTFTPLVAATAGSQVAAVLPAQCSPNPVFRVTGFAATGDRYTIASSNGNAITFTPRGTVLTQGNNDVDIQVRLDGSAIARCVRVSATLGLVRIGTLDAGNACANFQRF